MKNLTETVVEILSLYEGDKGFDPSGCLRELRTLQPLEAAYVAMDVFDELPADKKYCWAGIVKNKADRLSRIEGRGRVKNFLTAIKKKF